MSESVMAASHVGLWVAVALNTLLLLRVLTFFRAMHDVNVRAGEAPQPVIGDPAPPFRAPTVSGGEVALESFADRLLVLVFVSPHCGTCGRHMPAFERLGERAAERGAAVVLVSDSSESATRKWAQQVLGRPAETLSIPLAYAPRSMNRLAHVYNSAGLTPSFAVINSDGSFGGYDRVGSESWSELCRRLVGEQAAPAEA